MAVRGFLDREIERGEHLRAVAASAPRTSGAASARPSSGRTAAVSNKLLMITKSKCRACATSSRALAMRCAMVSGPSSPRRCSRWRSSSQLGGRMKISTACANSCLICSAPCQSISSTTSCPSASRCSIALREVPYRLPCTWPTRRTRRARPWRGTPARRRTSIRGRPAPGRAARAWCARPTPPGASPAPAAPSPGWTCRHRWVRRRKEVAGGWTIHRPQPGTQPPGRHRAAAGDGRRGRPCAKAAPRDEADARFAAPACRGQAAARAGEGTARQGGGVAGGRAVERHAHTRHALERARAQGRAGAGSSQRRSCASTSSSCSSSM
jgi:hypothetical protein